MEAPSPCRARGLSPRYGLPRRGMRRWPLSGRPFGSTGQEDIRSPDSRRVGAPLRWRSPPERPPDPRWCQEIPVVAPPGGCAPTGPSDRPWAGPAIAGRERACGASSSPPLPGRPRAAAPRRARWSSRCSPGPEAAADSPGCARPARPRPVRGPGPRPPGSLSGSRVPLPAGLRELEAVRGRRGRTPGR